MCIRDRCGPAAAKDSVGLLVQMAEKIGDFYLANQLAGDFASLSITNKRQRVDEQGIYISLFKGTFSNHLVVSNPVVSFDTMDEFYTALIEDER